MPARLLRLWRCAPALSTNGGNSGLLRCRRYSRAPSTWMPSFGWRLIRSNFTPFGGGWSLICRLPAASRQRYSELARSAAAAAACSATARSCWRRGISLVNHHHAAAPSATASNSMPTCLIARGSLGRRAIGLDRGLVQFCLGDALVGAEAAVSLAVAVGVDAEGLAALQPLQVGAGVQALLAFHRLDRGDLDRGARAVVDVASLVRLRRRGVGVVGHAVGVLPLVDPLLGQRGKGERQQGDRDEGEADEAHGELRGKAGTDCSTAPPSPQVRTLAGWSRTTTPVPRGRVPAASTCCRTCSPPAGCSAASSPSSPPRRGASRPPASPSSWP